MEHRQLDETSSKLADLRQARPGHLSSASNEVQKNIQDSDGSRIFNESKTAAQIYSDKQQVL